MAYVLSRDAGGIRFTGISLGHTPPKPNPKKMKRKRRVAKQSKKRNRKG